jgi:hypothetical protein
MTDYAGFPYLRYGAGLPLVYKMPAAETDEERRDREVAELKARAQRLEIGLGACVVLLVAFVVWAVFFRNSNTAPARRARCADPAPVSLLAPAARL